MLRSRGLKRVCFVISILCCAVYLTGCATVATPAIGLLYTDVTAPVAATGHVPEGKLLRGEASAKSVLGLFATGDASIQAAAKSAGITKIHHVDYHSKKILGFVATFTVIVYGER